MNEVLAGERPVGIERLPLGGGKVMDPVEDKRGLFPGKAFLVHEVGDPAIPVGAGEKDPPNPSGDERSRPPDRFFPFLEGFLGCGLFQGFEDGFVQRFLIGKARCCNDFFIVGPRPGYLLLRSIGLRQL